MRRNTEGYPSLYEIFHLGDRVRREYRGEDGKTVEYEGLILSMSENAMEVFWDTVDGEYNPAVKGFTRCSLEEIFEGTNGYTPIKRKRYIFPRWRF